MKGSLISFEGIDGAGKTTQIKLLSKYLESKGHNVIVLREPGGNDISEAIRSILLSSKNTMNYKTELLLFEAARAELVHTVIIPELNAGKIVMLDRFFDSTTAYQGYGRGLSIKDINMLNEFATSSIKPDLTFFLDIPFEITLERSKKRKLDRIELSGNTFFDKVITGFKALASHEPNRIYSINSTDEINKVHEFIVNLVINKLNLK